MDRRARGAELSAHNSAGPCACDNCCTIVAHQIAVALRLLTTIAPEARADVLAAALAKVPADVRATVRP